MKAAELEKRIRGKKAVVGIMGMGYVGLPLARTFGNSGFTCIGFDVDPNKVRMLNAGKSYIKHIPDAMIAGLKKAGRFRATADFRELRKPTRSSSASPRPFPRRATRT